MRFILSLFLCLTIGFVTKGAGFGTTSETVKSPIKIELKKVTMSDAYVAPDLAPNKAVSLSISNETKSKSSAVIEPLNHAKATWLMDPGQKQAILNDNRICLKPHITTAYLSPGHAYDTGKASKVKNTYMRPPSRC